MRKRGRAAIRGISHETPYRRSRDTSIVLGRAALRIVSSARCSASTDAGGPLIISFALRALQLHFHLVRDPTRYSTPRRRRQGGGRERERERERVSFFRRRQLVSRDRSPKGEINQERTRSAEAHRDDRLKRKGLGEREGGKREERTRDERNATPRYCARGGGGQRGSVGIEVAERGGETRDAR